MATMHADGRPDEVAGSGGTSPPDPIPLTPASPATAPTATTEACVGSPLMRISTFCSPRSDRSRRRRRHLESNIGEDVAAQKVGEFSSVAVAVSVRILDAVPSPNRTRRRTYRHHGVLDDLCASLYTDDPSLFSRVGAFEGSTVCCLSSNRSPPASHGWSPVLIRLLPRRAQMQAYEDGGTLNSLDLSSDDISASAAQPTLHVPPCVAASAGLFQFAPASLECAFLRRIGEISAKGTGKPVGGPWTRPASKVVVREMAAPTIVQAGNSKLISKKYTKCAQDESLRQYFLRDGANGMRDEAPRLMALGTIFAVPNIREENDANESQPQGDFVNGVRFYEVTSMIADDIEKEEDLFCAYIVSLSTKLVLEETSETSKWPRRLPGLNQALNFAGSIFGPARTDGPEEETGEHMARRIIPQHPSTGPIVDKLLMPLSSSSQVSNYFTLLVGGDGDNIDECVYCAADAVGMRCLVVDGLAAFDYRKKRQQQLSANNEDGKQKSNALVTGSLAEKLSGLQAAVDLALESLPCVFLLKNIDRELTAADVDSETRAEEEKRFAAVLVNAITQNSLPSDKRSAWNHLSPPVQFVISSTKPLAPGPLSSLSTGDVLKVSRPDDSYARHIWQSCSHLIEEELPPFDEVRPQLLGRTADEIKFAKQEILARLQSSGNLEESPMATLSSIFETLDKGHVVVAEGGESRLSSTLIPDIKWEDVGGLSHVRSEVVDAIELPLRHPELFSGRGRSGLCLFGPPGTGKTLVAKAVATECGLPFLSVKGPELLGSYVGESEANVRAAFQNAREAAAAKAGREKGGAAILFFDELDSLAPRRGGVGDGGGVMERVVATLLGEMDSGSTSPGDEDADVNIRVFVIGATNRPDLLDPSLLRPGRFDRLVYLGLAQSREDRIKILVAQTRKFTFADDRDAHTIIDEVIDSIPASLSGADLSAVAKGALMRSMTRLCNEADAELSRMKDEGKDVVDIDAIVNGWEPQKLVPKVTAEDFIVAAKDVTPSVSSKELANYEQLKQQFCA